MSIIKDFLVLKSPNLYTGGGWKCSEGRDRILRSHPPSFCEIFCEAVDVVGSSGSRAHLFVCIASCELFSCSSPPQKMKNSHLRVLFTWSVGAGPRLLAAGRRRRRDRCAASARTRCVWTSSAAAWRSACPWCGSGCRSAGASSRRRSWAGRAAGSADARICCTAKCEYFTREIYKKRMNGHILLNKQIFSVGKWMPSIVTHEKGVPVKYVLYFCYKIKFDELRTTRVLFLDL